MNNGVLVSMGDKKILNEESCIEDDYINDYESSRLKHIWGIVSPDDISGNDSNLWTLNNMELLYWKETDDYSVELETMFLFEEKKAEKEYVKRLLNAFTNWMTANGYNTEATLRLYGVFTEGYNMNSRFPTIEEAYANFKLLANGFCSL